MIKNEPPENIPSAFKREEEDNRPDFIKKLDNMVSAGASRPYTPKMEGQIAPSFNPSFKLQKTDDLKKKKEAEAKRVSYVKRVMSFYFAPLLRSFGTILYLLFFLYFVLFYFENLIVGVRFLLYTVSESTLALSLDHLFWGALFTIALVIPFSVSMYAIFIPFEVSHKTSWNRAKKITIILFAFIATIDVIIVSDFAIKFMENQRPIRKFLYDKEIVIRKTY